MTEKELQSFLDQTAEKGDLLRNLYISQAPDDTFGWASRLEYMWTKDPNCPYGLLLTGPEGCGKHTAAIHMYRVISEDFYLVPISGSELCEGGLEKAKDRLFGVIKHYVGNQYAMCLVLDGLENCSFRKELLSSLGQLLTVIWLRNTEYLPVFFILIDTYGEDVPATLRGFLRCCKMSLPNAARRRALLKSDQFPTIISLPNLDLLVAETDGLTYAQLLDLLRNLEGVLFCLPTDQPYFSDEELLEFVREQKPDIAIPSDPMESLAQSAREFLRNLPELMSHMGTAVISGGSVISSNDAANKDDNRNTNNKQDDKDEVPTQPSKKEIEDMPVKDLALNVLGSDRMQRLAKKQSSLQKA